MRKQILFIVIAFNLLINVISCLDKTKDMNSQCFIERQIQEVRIDERQFKSSLQTSSSHPFKIFGDFPTATNTNININILRRMFNIATKYYQSVITVTTLPTGSTVYVGQSECGKVVNSSLRTVGFNQTLYDAVYFIIINSDCQSRSVAQAVSCTQAKWITYAFITYNAYYITTDLTKVANFHSNIMITVRQIGHILGMSSSLFSRFFPSYDSTQHLDVRQVQLRREGRSYIITASVKDYVQSHFNCADITLGALIQQEGCQGLVGSYWERKVYYDQVLTASVLPTGVRVTPLTLSLFKDTGFYYSVDIAKAETSYFGKGKGCSFASGETTDSRQYCSDSGNQCGFYYEYEGHCDDESYSSRTSYIKPYSNRICSQPESATDSTFDVFAADSRCADFIHSFDNSKAKFCWRAQCTTDKTIIYHNHVADSIVTCQVGQLTATTSIAGQQGTMICPVDHQAFCGRVNCQNWCYNQGMCLRGVCLVADCSLAIQNCLACDYNIVNRCTLCMHGYYTLGNQLECLKCSSAIQNCQLCSMNSQLKCDVCVEGLFASLDQKKCMNCQDIIQGCKTCKVDGITKCVQCLNEYIIPENQLSCQNNNRLLSADCNILGCLNCRIKNKITICEKCNQKFIQNYNNDQCLQCSSLINYCQQCTNNNHIIQCSVCLSGYQLNDDKLSCSLSCSSIISYCLSCNPNKNNVISCSSCQTGYILSEDKLSCSNIFYLYLTQYPLLYLLSPKGKIKLIVLTAVLIPVVLCILVLYYLKRRKSKQYKLVQTAESNRTYRQQQMYQQNPNQLTNSSN